MLKPLLLLSAVILFEFTPMSAPVLMPQEATPAPAASADRNPVKPTPESQAWAKRLFGIDCVMCHGTTGNGKGDLANELKLKIPDFTDPMTLASKSDEELFNIIRNGNTKMQMPPEAEDRAKNDDVWNLIIYIRGLSKEQPAAATNGSK